MFYSKARQQVKQKSIIGLLWLIGNKKAWFTYILAMRRVLLLGIISSALLGLIASTFWQQELQYLLPTPVPANYKVVPPGSLITFNHNLQPQRHTKPILLHFFSPSCPCSRFNLRHFTELYRKFGKQVDFFCRNARCTRFGKSQRIFAGRNYSDSRRRRSACPCLWCIFHAASGNHSNW